MTIQPRVGRGPTTIADVAKLARVSITTVSHVLSGKRPVAEATRRRVLEATQELNYRPAMTARGLATGRAMALGLQFPFEGEQLLLNPYFPAVLESLSAAAIEAGFTFVLLPARRSEAFPLDILLESQQLVIEEAGRKKVAALGFGPILARADASPPGTPKQRIAPRPSLAIAFRQSTWRFAPCASGALIPTGTQARRRGRTSASTSTTPAPHRGRALPIRASPRSPASPPARP